MPDKIQISPCGFRQYRFGYSHFLFTPETDIGSLQGGARRQEQPGIAFKGLEKSLIQDHLQNRCGEIIPGSIARPEGFE
ncbi:MAG: hypothetical protein BWY09_03053 [Candidatus Hydrogenedentes bacterium ADurb.Bin179]|nr:MAG: hypothetical protein BWY09_03053 [Candidatus Hydrogenedentes bacterium ADurb.Bin179]